MRKYLLFSLTMLLLAQQTLGQERIVRGTVTDQSDGSTLPGVSIRIKGTDQGTVTDQDGKFSISVPGDSEILVFSFIGMKTLEKQIPASGVLDVAMESQQVGLDEVVVIGYGTVKKRDLTGSVSSVSSDEPQEIPSNSFDQEIQGRISGVNVTVIILPDVLTSANAVRITPTSLVSKALGFTTVVALHAAGEFVPAGLSISKSVG